MTEFHHRMRLLLGTEEFEAFFESLSSPGKRSLRYDPNKVPESELIGTAIPWCAPWGRWWEEDTPPSAQLGYALGDFYIQESSAMLAVSAAQQAVDFTGKRVLDLCAAPGGKSTQAAEKAELLVANEAIQGRLSALVWNLVRHRAANTVVTALQPKQLSALLPEWFDIVLVDAPCSGEGLMARGKLDPEAWRMKQVTFCAERQRSILRDALTLLAPGGTLVYSTCTFAPEENEENTRFLLNIGLEPISFPEAIQISPAISDDSRIVACSRRIFPHREGGAGAYVSLLHKPESDSVSPTFRKMKWKPVRKLPELLRSPENGMIVEHRGALHYLQSNVSLPAILAERATEIGLSLYHPKTGYMHGAVGLAAEKAMIELDDEQIPRYLHGEDLTVTADDGWHFAAVGGRALGLLKISNGRGVNHFPESLRVK